MVRVSFSLLIAQLQIDVRNPALCVEHGAGVEKPGQMCVQFNAAEISRFHAVKSVFYARGLLNPDIPRF